MIKVAKSTDTPQSLSSAKNYDGEDVKCQLLANQHGKCYLCERRCITDFQVEHLRSKKNYPALTYDWRNLFMACGYCNGRKSNKFDDILNPSEAAIENIIHQEYDYENKRFLFSSADNATAVCQTIELLNRLYNGNGTMRTTKESRFTDYILKELTIFLRMVNDYLSFPSTETAAPIRDELSITSENLGLKYWIIKSNPHLAEAFAEDIKWNK